MEGADHVYCKGSTGVGREERCNFWFNPTDDFHHYSILWIHDRIIFYIDEVPIREVVRSQAMGADFPSRPMSLYATIWDGSSWATSGGRYKVKYKYAPYIAKIANLSLHGCIINPTNHSFPCDDSNHNLFNAMTLSSDQRLMMVSHRRKYMSYLYCYDVVRYSNPPPECAVAQHVAEHLGGYRKKEFELNCVSHILAHVQGTFDETIACHLF